MSTGVSSSSWPSRISAFRAMDQRMLIFPSREERDECGNFLELAEIPYEIAPSPEKEGASGAFVVPRSAVSLIKAKGLKFKALKPIAESDLKQAQRKDLRYGRTFLIKTPAKETPCLFLSEFPPPPLVRRELTKIQNR